MYKLISFFLFLLAFEQGFAYSLSPNSWNSKNYHLFAVNFNGSDYYDDEEASEEDTQADKKRYKRNKKNRSVLLKDYNTAVATGLALSPLNGAGLYTTGHKTLGVTLFSIEAAGLVTGAILILNSRSKSVITEDDFITGLTGLAIIAATFIPTYLIDLIGTIWVISGD